MAADSSAMTGKHLLHTATLQMRRRKWYGYFDLMFAKLEHIEN